MAGLWNFLKSIEVKVLGQFRILKKGLTLTIFIRCIEKWIEFLSSGLLNMYLSGVFKKWRGIFVLKNIIINSRLQNSSHSGHRILVSV